MEYSVFQFGMFFRVGQKVVVMLGIELSFFEVIGYSFFFFCYLGIVCGQDVNFDQFFGLV